MQAWLEIAVFTLTVVVTYHLFRLLVNPPPKPRWKTIFLCAAASALGGLASVGHGAPWHWAFVIFGMTMMLVALFVYKPRDEQISR